jgi:hypothetical protein
MHRLTVRTHFAAVRLLLIYEHCNERGDACDKELAKREQVLADDADCSHPCRISPQQLKRVARRLAEIVAIDRGPNQSVLAHLVETLLKACETATHAANYRLCYVVLRVLRFLIDVLEAKAHETVASSREVMSYKKMYT